MDLQIEYVSKEELKPYANNAKIHTAEQIEQIKRSIEEFGFKDPIAVWHDNEIIEGHGRLLAAMEMDEITEVPVIRLDDLTDEQARAFRLADNKVGELAEWDDELLSLELGAIDLDMGQFGFLDDADFDISVDELDADETEEKTVVRFVFDDYNDYKENEREIKEFAENIGAKMTIGK